MNANLCMSGYRVKSKFRKILAVCVLGLVSAIAIAAATHEDFLHALAVRESSLDPTKTNVFGYTGLFQMGEAALQDAGYYKGDSTPKKNDWGGAFTGKNGINSIGDFKANPDAQVAAVVAYHNAVWKSIQALGLDKAIGQTINGLTITQSGLIAGAHLVGVGNLQKFINSNGATIPVDGNGTPISEYISKFGGYAIAGTPPSYATVLAASGAGGFGAPPAAPPTSTPLPVGPMPHTVSPGTAFATATGFTADQVKNMISVVIAMFMMTWVAWTSYSQFNSWRQGNISLGNLQGDILRSLMVFSIAVIMLQ
jgi:integrating conjugative element protein (TIGR03758 family)